MERRRQRKRQVPLNAERGDAEQSDADSHAQDAEVPTARNEPPGDGSHGGNSANATNDQQNPREPSEKRIREWLLVSFTGIIVFGTWYSLVLLRNKPRP